MGLGGFIAARRLGIPYALAAPVVAAFLWEFSFYLAAGFAKVRQAVQERWRRSVIAGGLLVSALLPYAVYSIPTGTFEVSGLGGLLVAAGIVAFWFVVLPAGKFSDYGFLVFMAAVVLSRIFTGVYRSPLPGVSLAVLGQLMWIRLGIWTMLCIRKLKGTDFGFWPRRTDWLVGVQYFLVFLPVGVGLGLASGLLQYRPLSGSWSEICTYAAGTFLGMLWVVALSEEFFFRGVLQPWLSREFNSKLAGLLTTAVLFGAVHLPFRGFPNWRFAALAALAGVFYGRAFEQARSIRAPMVTHALVNTVMRLFFG